jgi:hypothetical protein
MRDMDNKPQSRDRLLPVARVRERYSICTRTVDRWLQLGLLPPPLRIRNLRYWRLEALEEFERARAQDSFRPIGEAAAEVVRGLKDGDAP